MPQIRFTRLSGTDQYGWQHGYFGPWFHGMKDLSLLFASRLIPAIPFVRRDGAAVHGNLLLKEAGLARVDMSKARANLRLWVDAAWLH